MFSHNGVLVVFGKDTMEVMPRPPSSCSQAHWIHLIAGWSHG